jgi:hypothetical protein
MPGPVCWIILLWDIYQIYPVDSRGADDKWTIVGWIGYG